MTDSYVGDGETMPTTPDEALELLSGFISTTDSAEDREDIGFAINILANHIRKWDGHDCDDIIPWGEPGDCWDRLYNDPDYAEDKVFKVLIEAASNVSGGIEDDAVVAYAKEHGYGQHYGNPHCIWCLQAD